MKIIKFILFILLSINLSLASETIKAAVPADFPPYYSVNKNGKIEGFAIDTFNNVANNAGYKVEYVIKDTFWEAIKSLENGEVDVVPNYGITTERTKKLIFTVPMETFSIRAFKRKGLVDLNTLEDIKNKKIVVVKTNVGFKLMKNHPKELLKVVSNSKDALISLLSGESDVWIYPESVVYNLLKQLKLKDKIVSFGKPLKEIKRAIGIKKDRTELANKLNVSLQEFMFTDEFKNIYSKWMGNHDTFEITKDEIIHIVGSVVSTILLLVVLVLLYTRKKMKDVITERTKELHRANIELKKLSQTDALTGIANRAKFDIHLEQLCRRQMRYQKPISLLIVDIDHFKDVNDTYGHQVGDEYLQKVANVLQNSVNRVDDLPARYGGEEFALVLEDTSESGAMKVAEKLRKDIHSLHLENKLSKVSPYVTVSIGIATVQPNSDASIEKFIKQADDALYYAKRNGRNKAITFEKCVIEE